MFSKWYGMGPDVAVGLHGWSGDHRTFEPLEPWRPTSVRLLMVDLPGYAKSAPPAHWTLDAVAQELSEHLDQVGVKKFTLLGNCSGAIVGLHLARLVPERIVRFVMIDPFSFVPWYFRLFLQGSIGSRAYHVTFATHLGRRLTNGALARRRTDASHLTSSFEEVNHNTVLRYLHMMDEVGDIQQFAGLKMPLALTYGEKTFVAVKKSIGHWKALWPRAAIHLLRGAGHLPIEEAPAALAQIAFGSGAPAREETITSTGGRE